MDKKYYTNTNTHPEDEIYRVKNFINELQKVQDQYFEKLVNNLRIDSQGEGFLFDYIFNADSEDNQKTFEEYIVPYTAQPYESFVTKKGSEKIKVVPFEV